VSRASYTYRWWDGPVYWQTTFETKREKDDFVAEVRRRRRLGLSLSFELEEDDTLRSTSASTASDRESVGCGASIDNRDEI
jgi:hypothetical protein